METKISLLSSTCNYPHFIPPKLNDKSSISLKIINYPFQFFPPGSKLKIFKYCKTYSSSKIESFGSINEEKTSWDEKPFEILPNGKRVYLDEQDIVSFLDPPKELIPLDPSTFNPASYLWKKISEIPEERRHHLLHLLNPSLISAAWEVAGTRYDDAKLAKRSSSTLLSGENDSLSLEFWNCHKSGGPMPVSLIGHLKKALFRKDGKVYGRLIVGSLLDQIATSFRPLYFTVKEVREVMPTEQPCDLAFEFGDGLLDLHGFPEGFPAPAKHPWPFNDQIVIYVRHVGPGVMVGQVWQEGLELEQVPKKLCNDILMIKDYSAA